MDIEKLKKYAENAIEAGKLVKAVTAFKNELKDKDQMRDITMSEHFKTLREPLIEQQISIGFDFLCRDGFNSEHSLSHTNHSNADMQLIPLEIIHSSDSSRDSIRKVRESHLVG